MMDQYLRWTIDNFSTVSEKTWKITVFSQRIQKMDEAISPLRAAYKKLEREKMAVVLSLQFSASHELPLRTEILQKNSVLFDLRTKLSSSQQDIRDQSSELSLKDGQLTSKNKEILALHEQLEKEKRAHLDLQTSQSDRAVLDCFWKTEEGALKAASFLSKRSCIYRGQAL